MAKANQPEKTSKKTPPTAAAEATPAANPSETDPAKARERLAATGRNEPCACGSGKKYKKCHLAADEQATIAPIEAPDAKVMLANGWRLFEQRRPGAAEKEFRAALDLDGELLDARVGIGMSRLSANNAEGAKEELGAVLAVCEKQAVELREKKVKNAFSDPAAQPYIRAAHALGCLAYDEDRFEDAVKELERVHAIDDGTVGIEARLISSKALMKLEKPADAAALLEPAAKLPDAAGRVDLSLALALFASGKADDARKALEAALDSNPHYGKAVLGRVRRRVENVAAAQPGSLEQALLYAQTYGDVWTDEAKKFLDKTLDERAEARRTAAQAAGEETAGGEEDAASPA